MSIRVLPVSPCGGHLSGCRTKRLIDRSVQCSMYVMSSKNVNVSVVIPWVELRSYSTTPSVDGDRGDPIPDQAYMKKKITRQASNLIPMFVYVWVCVAL